ncbi:iron-containing alcohol dehydrogenase [Salinicoccus sp. Marseille-QA3877]
MSHLSSFPERLLFGDNALEDVKGVLKEFQSKNVLIVTDKGLVKAGVVENVLDVLKSEELNFHIFDNTNPEPTISNFKEALEENRSNEIDLVIGLGGGSPIDLGKAVALFLKHDAEFLDYVGVNKVPSKGLPTIMISTTSGTGSEVSKFAVLTDEKTKLKSVIASPNIVPTISVVDPQLTASLPPHITANTGIDALVHCIEGYLAVRNSNLSNELALVGLGKIWNNLQAAYDDGGNKDARYEMSLGSMLGGLVLNTTDGAGMVHGLAFSLGVYCNLPHGLSNSLVLPYTLDYLKPHAIDSLNTLAIKVNIEGSSKEEKVDNFIKEIFELQKNLNIPVTLEEMEINKELIPKLAESSNTQERLQTNSPKRLEVQEIEHIFTNAFEGKVSFND